MNQVKPKLRQPLKPVKPSIPKRYSLPTLIGLFIVVILLARATWGVYGKEQESRNNLAAVHAEFETLQKRQSLLKEETDKLNTQEGIEEEIRQKFQVAKPGESLLVVVDKPLPESTEDKDKGILSKIWSSMSGVFKKKQ